MMKTSNSDERTKPENLPNEAIWCAEDSEWVKGVKDEDGKYHGEVHYWREDGTANCVAELAHGVASGPFQRFHENGEVSMTGSYVDGNVEGKCTSMNCHEPTTERMPGGIDERIWRAELTYSLGKYEPMCYFLEDGSEVNYQGQPLETRPAGVPEDALRNLKGWVSGWTEGTQVTRWLEDGTLTQTEVRFDDGTCEELTTYEDGKIQAYKRFFPNETRQLRRTYHRNVSYEDVNDIDGRCIQKSSWYTKDHGFHKEKLFFYEGEKLARVRERKAPGYVSYEAILQTDGKTFCEFFSKNGVPTMSGYVESDLLTGIWNLHIEEATVDTTGLEISVDPKNSDLAFSVYSVFFDVSLPALVASTDADFLKKLDTIDWGNAESCYGDSESVRDGIIGLTSPFGCIRNKAMGMVSGETLHQGSLYEVTALAAPFLVDLLDHPNADPELLLRQLRWYAESAHPYAEQALAAKAEMTDEDEDWTISVLGPLDAISAGWEKIVKFSDDAILVNDVISLAKYGPAAAKDFLFEHAKSEDPLKRATAVDAFADFSAFKENELLIFLEDDSLLVRLVAAIRTALFHGGETPKTFVDELIKSLDNYEDVEESYAQILSNDSALLADIAIALASIRSSQTKDLLGWLCDNIDTVDIGSATLYGRALLMLAFGGIGEPFADVFIVAMKTLAKSKQFNAFNVNAREVLGMWLLPDDQELFDLAEEMEKKENPEETMRSWLEAKMQ